MVQAQIYDETPNKPNIPLECEFVVGMDELNQTYKDLDIIKTNSLDISVNANELVLGSTEQSMTQYSHNIYVESSAEAKSRYSLKYMKDITKFKKISDIVKVKIGDDMPLIWSLTGENVSIEGLIAPLIEMDD